MSLEKETVMWSRGLMVLPPGVKQMLHALLGLLDRLSALELTVLLQRLRSCDMRSYVLYQWAPACHAPDCT